MFSVPNAMIDGAFDRMPQVDIEAINNRRDTFLDALDTLKYLKLDMAQLEVPDITRKIDALEDEIRAEMEAAECEI